MKRALSLTALIFALVLAIPAPSAACYDTCAPGSCRICETGLDVTFQVCIQTAPCNCITYFVPWYECTGLTTGGTAASVPVPELTGDRTPAQPEAAVDLSFLASP